MYDRYSRCVYVGEQRTAVTGGTRGKHKKREYSSSHVSCNKSCRVCVCVCVRSTIGHSLLEFSLVVYMCVSLCLFLLASRLSFMNLPNRTSFTHFSLR